MTIHLFAYNGMSLTKGREIGAKRKMDCACDSELKASFTNAFELSVIISFFLGVMPETS